MFAFIQPLDGQGATVPGTPLPTPPSGLHPGGGPIVLPPLPGIWPKPGHPNLPVDPGFGVDGGLHPGGGPIIIPEPVPPMPTFPAPPGSVWPPLPPTTTGKYAVLILVLGVGYRWLIVESPDLSKPVPPPAAEVN